MTKALTAVFALLLLAACGGQTGLHTLGSNDEGPDEFGVLPTAPLQMPADLSHLPAPTPGAANLVDPNPNAAAIAALGGRPSAARAGGVPASDAALIGAASRFGVSAGIRATLAAEDRARRAGGGRIAGLFGGDRYFALYARERLNAYAELERLRALGVATPTAPPR